MGKRKSLTKKIRFEVFKRDKFTCQYCGRSAPDVVLEVDHINPVSQGGTNEIMNLVTSCFDCNRGKGANKISDASVVKRQRDQLIELQERREQLDMMLEWRKELQNLQEDSVIAFENTFCDYTGYKLTSDGKKRIRKWIKEFSLKETLDALDIAVDSYFYGTSESERDAENAFEKVPGICHFKRIQAGERNDPRFYYANYLAKAVSNNGWYCNKGLLKQFIFENVLNEDDFEKAKKCLNRSRNWSTFCEKLSDTFNDLL